MAIFVTIFKIRDVTLVIKYLERIYRSKFTADGHLRIASGVQGGNYVDITQRRSTSNRVFIRWEPEATINKISKSYNNI
jgi:hypothetical protein